MFRIGLLCEALERAGDGVTDEAGAIEALGLAPLLVAGSARNFKLTYAEDFELAEALLAKITGSGLPTAVVPPTFADGLACMKIIDAMRASAASGGALQTL